MVLMNDIENTTYSGVDKDFALYSYETFEYEPKDYKGKKLYAGDEYFIVEHDNGFTLVHNEEIQNYMYDKTNDVRLLTEDYDHLKQLLALYHNVYVEVFT